VRLEEIGTAMISLEECCWEMQLQQQRQQLVVVPIRLRKDGWASDAMLYVSAIFSCLSPHPPLSIALLAICNFSGIALALDDRFDRFYGIIIALTMWLMIQVNVELVDVNTRSDVERAVSFREKPRTSMPPPAAMRDHRKSLEAAAYHDVLDLRQLLDLAEEGQVAVFGSKRISDSSSVSSISSSCSSTTSISSASTSGGASPEPASMSKRRFLPWMRRSRDFDKRSSESLSQELPMKCMVSSV